MRATFPTPRRTENPSSLPRPSRKSSSHSRASRRPSGPVSPSHPRWKTAPATPFTSPRPAMRATVSPPLLLNATTFGPTDRTSASPSTPIGNPSTSSTRSRKPWATSDQPRAKSALQQDHPAHRAVHHAHLHGRLPRPRQHQLCRAYHESRPPHLRDHLRLLSRRLLPHLLPLPGPSQLAARPPRRAPLARHPP